MRKRFSDSEIHRLSRDTGVLARGAVLIGAFFVILAFLNVSLRSGHPSADPSTVVLPHGHPRSEARASAEGADVDPRDVLLHLRQSIKKLRAQALPPPEDPDNGILPIDVFLRHFHDPELAVLFQAYHTAALAQGPKAEEHRALLEERAAQSPPPPYANEMVGDLLQWEGQPALAAQHYRREADFPDAHYARQELFRYLVDTKDREALKELMGQAAFSQQNHQQWLQLGVALRDPEFILRGVLLHDYADLPLIVWVLTLPVTFLWFWILKKICFIPSWKSPAIALGAAGIVLGVLSTTATLFAVVWQEEIWGLEFTGEPAHDLAVYVLGVGVREETIKLLFFLPLVPWLYRLRDARAVLLVAASVGLGFAAQENIGYFQRFGATLSRFVTANFFHMILTGTLGFALCRFLYTPRSEWNRFLATFIAAIVIHGLYDFLLGLSQGGFFAILLFCATAYFFFDLVEKHCPPHRQTISPLSVFVLGCSIIFGCSLLATSSLAPSLYTALSRSGDELLGVVPLMFLYINRFRNA